MPLANIRLSRCLTAAGLWCLVLANSGNKVEAEAPHTFVFAPADLSELPPGKVRVEVVEKLSQERSWEFTARKPEHLFDTEFFAMKNLPNKYDAAGLRVRRKSPLLLHMSGRLEVPAGEYELLLRSVDAARLYLDGKLLTEIPFNLRKGTAHSPYYEGLDRGPEILSLAEGHTEQTVRVQLAGGGHVLSVYRLFVSPKLSQHLGELLLAIRPVNGAFRIPGMQRDLPFTDAGWLAFLDWEAAHLDRVNAVNRQQAANSHRSYWDRRHAFARAATAEPVPVPSLPGNQPVGNEIDRFVLSKLADAEIASTGLVDDLSFLRRLSLDTIGIIPSEEMVDEFESYPREARRQHMIDRLLQHPGWADHWVAYWQDVLAENPGLIKPELNNTGPFRWFVYDSFRDNKPFDRFVTELIMMGGDPYAGGPAGFAVASQNDAPMAAKAHIIGSAFLGVEMKCARCHDAPYHDVTQEQLFQMAAMLHRGRQPVPLTSSIPAAPDVLERMIVKVTLPPGSAVLPCWPFENLLATTTGDEGLPDWFLTDSSDTRERLAALLTTPANRRFSEMIVNRLWRRYVGRGLVEPIDDWETATATHPELLAYLSRELIAHDYDLQHVARLIFNSHVYQREPFSQTAENADRAALFPGPRRRRMTAEQLTDSLFAVAGKPFGCEELTMGSDGRLSGTSFGYFGIPRRAWEFVGVGNERDRPSLNLPTAQSIIQFMSAFGWRAQRQEPLTLRPDSLTPLQPLSLANGTAVNRAIDLSDHSRLTALCLDPQPLDRFVERLCTRILTRTPTREEQQRLMTLLGEGYESRVVAGDEVIQPQRIYRSGVTWTSHFDPQSDAEIVRRQREIQEGDAPTRRLDPQWRQTAEDVVWALVNSPEFVFVP